MSKILLTTFPNGRTGLTWSDSWKVRQFNRKILINAWSDTTLSSGINYADATEFNLHVLQAKTSTQMFLVFSVEYRGHC